jgi:acylglycerol lipase
MDSPTLQKNEKSMYFVAQDGLKLYVKQYLPAAAIIGVVMMAPGIGGIRANDWDELGDYLSRAGYVVLVLHDRGTGYSEGVRGDLADYRLVIEDFEFFLKDGQSTYPEKPVFLLGHSLGGITSIQIAHDLDDEVSGVVIINPAYRYRKKAGPSFSTYLTYGFNALFRPAALTVDMMGRDTDATSPIEDRAELWARRNDPMIVRKFSMRYMLSVRKVMKRAILNAKYAKQPLLLIYGAKDPFIDHRGSEEIFAAWGCPNKKKVVVQDGGHGVHVAIRSKTAILEWLNETTNDRQTRLESTRQVLDQGKVPSGYGY